MRRRIRASLEDDTGNVQFLKQLPRLAASSCGSLQHAAASAVIKWR